MTDPRIFLSLLALLIPAIATHNRAIILGIDGLNPSCLMREIERLPNIKKLMESGSYTMRARATIQAMSAPGWASIFCAMEPVDTGILANEWEAPWVRWENGSAKNVEITPASGRFSPMPCVFQLVKENNPNYRTVFTYDWHWLKNFGNGAIPGNFIDFEDFCNSKEETEESSKCGAAHIQAIHKLVRAGDFDFAAFYFEDLDLTGHQYSFCNEQYQNYLITVDNYVLKVTAALEAAGLLESTYIILTSDHGASPGDLNHGLQNDQNLFVPWIVRGPGVRQNYKIKNTNVHISDTVPTLFAGLEFKPHSLWRGMAAKEIFENEGKRQEEL